MPALFAFLHHVAAFALVAAIAVELVLVTLPATPTGIRRLAVTDLFVGLSAIVLFVVGLVRVFLLEKGPGFYFSDGPFLIKLVAFLALGVLSVLPTREFVAWRRELANGNVPSPGRRRRGRVRNILLVQTGALIVIILCSALMADGIGRFG